MFQDRARLHRQGYQHRVVGIIDRMLIDAFLEANDHIRIKGENGNSYRLSEACRDMTAHEKLTDSVFEKISESDCENAKVILRRIQKREFYKSIAEIHPQKESYLFTMDAQNIEKEVRAYIPQCEGVKITNGSTDSHHNVSSKTVSTNKLDVEQQQLTKDEVVVVVNNSGQSPNPIEKVTFYSKNGNDEKLTQIESRNMSYSLPDHALRPAIFVCCKRNETRALKEAVAAVKCWSKEKNIPIEFH